jgi:uncharacterized protein YegJ (DUF2314 family)
MFSFLRREIPAMGRVLYPGAVPLPFDQLEVFKEPSVRCTTVAATPEQLWAVQANHDEWGAADIVCERRAAPLPELMIEHAHALSGAEKARARLGESTIAVRVHAKQASVLRDRKRLLFWLRALMQDDGVLAIDAESWLLWSPAMLADELSHGADLDVEALYTIHAVQDPENPERITWMHTHGLAALGAFDVDILQPTPSVVFNANDVFRALAFAALEGKITPDTARFTLAMPGGHVRLVPVDQFHAQAAAWHEYLRVLDETHGPPRAVLCDPAGGLFGRWRKRPVPSRFFSQLHSDNLAFAFSTEATALTAERARQTIAVFRALFAEFAGLELTALVKLAYEIDGDPTSREHLWFEVHGVGEHTIDATLVNAPHRIAAMNAGQRGEYPLDRLSDWTILSPLGRMTPRDISAARLLREKRDEVEASK